MRGTASSERASSAILTVPNALSAVRIAFIPLFFWLIVRHGSTMAGLLVFAGVVSTDWVDGYVARRFGQVSELGRMLDPAADRLVIVSGLIALVIRGVFPLWAAVLVLTRDVAVLAVGAVLLAGKQLRIDVRVVGKVATFSLMAGIPAIAWGTSGLALAELALAVGWVLFAVAIVEYYVAASVYVGDIRRALASA
jgi:cardiolipin synthase (CMP-forming)